jgi:hypothetical protein
MVYVTTAYKGRRIEISMGMFLNLNKWLRARWFGTIARYILGAEVVRDST